MSHCLIRFYIHITNKWMPSWTHVAHSWPREVECTFPFLLYHMASIYDKHLLCHCPTWNTMSLGFVFHRNFGVLLSDELSMLWKSRFTGLVIVMEYARSQRSPSVPSEWVQPQNSRWRNHPSFLNSQSTTRFREITDILNDVILLTHWGRD